MPSGTLRWLLFQTAAIHVPEGGKTIAFAVRADVTVSHILPLLNIGDSLFWKVLVILRYLQ